MTGDAKVNHVGGEFGQMHWSHLGYAPMSERAVAAVATIIPLDAWMAEHEPRHLRVCGAEASGGVLTFGFETPRPIPRVRARLPDADLAPFHRFLDARTGATGERDAKAQDEDQAEDLLRLRCLAWLARELNAPVAYWYHEGDNGLNYEYAWGLWPATDAGAHGTARSPPMMMFFNDREAPPATDPPEVPASALTACLWHVGARVVNRGEAAWIHHRLLHRTLDRRPFPM